MNAKWARLGLSVGLSLSMFVGLVAAPAARAEDPKKATSAPAAVKPSTQPKDEPCVPSVKGNDEKSRAIFLARHEGFLKDKAALLAKGPIQFVAIGDSITDGWRGRGKEVWEKTFAPCNAYNIGIGGDRTQHVLWRIDNGELDGIKPNPKVAMIMIGTNNLSNPDDAAIAAGVVKIVKEVREKLPQTKVLLLGIFPRNAGGKDLSIPVGLANDPVRARLKHINSIICQLDDGGKTVKYLDIGDKFLTADGTLTRDVMPDFLHPNAKGYEIWADAVKPVIEQMTK